MIKKILIKTSFLNDKSYNLVSKKGSFYWNIAHNYRYNILLIPLNKSLSRTWRIMQGLYWTLIKTHLGLSQGWPNQCQLDGLALLLGSLFKLIKGRLLKLYLSIRKVQRRIFKTRGNDEKCIIFQSFSCIFRYHLL